MESYPSTSGSKSPAAQPKRKRTWLVELGSYKAVSGTVFPVAFVTAAKEQDWVEVEVRRPLEAVINSEFGPWRAVRLGLGQWDP